MNWELLSTVFTTVFLAELGDKTQLATLLYASREDRALLTVFIGAAGALVLTTALGVTIGGFIGRLVSPRALAYVAGTGFILVGIWTIVKA